MAQTTDSWTTEKLLDWMTQSLESHEVDSPRVLAEMLLTEVYGGNRIDLYANAQRIATTDEREQLRSLVARAMKHEPVQYILGKSLFFGHEFSVNQSTLIPRSCTEVLVIQAIEHCKNLTHTPRIADIGTGSGCIGITLAKQLDADITLTDISADALALAQKNAENLGVSDSLMLIQGDGLEPLAGTFDVLCSNPPYIPSHEMDELAPNVKDWEPALALHGGSDGLSVICPLLEQAHEYLSENGCLLIEISPSITAELNAFLTSHSTLRDGVIFKDQYGDERFLRAYKS